MGLDKCKRKELPIPNCDEAYTLLSGLNYRAASAAKHFGAFRGAEAAFRQAKLPQTTAGNQADLFMMSNVFLAIICIDATLERTHKSSLQSLYRFLKEESCLTDIVHMLDRRQEAPVYHDLQTAVTLQDLFLEEYKNIGLTETRFKHLTHFRNEALAHIGSYNSEKKIAFDEIGMIIESACEAIFYANRLLGFVNPNGNPGIPSPYSSFEQAKKNATAFWMKALHITDD